MKTIRQRHVLLTRRVSSAKTRDILSKLAERKQTYTWKSGLIRQVLWS